MMAALVVMMASTAPQDRPQEITNIMKAFIDEQTALGKKPMTDCKPNVGKNGPENDFNSDQDCVKKYKGTKYQVCGKSTHVFTKNHCCSPNPKK